MVGESQIEDSFKSIFVVLIAVTVVYILIISFYGARLEEGTICRGHAYTNYTNNPVQDSGMFICGTDESILQRYSIANDGNVEYGFCYSLGFNTSDGFRISVVNENGTVLGKEFVSNATSKYCTSLDASKVAKNGYIGIRCDTCKSNERIWMKEEILGTSVKRVKNNGTVEIDYGNTLDFVLYSKEDCRGFITFFTRWYITILGFLGVALLILIGTKKFIRGVIEDD